MRNSVNIYFIMQMRTRTSSGIAHFSYYLALCDLVADLYIHITQMSIDCSVSVSYTHLDVYKRQLCHLSGRQLL